MIRYFCDACGKEGKLENVDFHDSESCICNWDLCPECRDKISEVVRNIRRLRDKENANES